LCSILPHTGCQNLTDKYGLNYVKFDGFGTGIQCVIRIWVRDVTDLLSEIRACTLCRDRFAATQTRHAPRPVVWFRPGARILIAGQAPGARVHASGRPFSDPSGDRLRDWTGLSPEQFYDRDRVAIVPMAFCFPGYDAKGADLPPPPVCARTWHARVSDYLGDPPLTLLVGGYAHRWHLGTKAGVTDTVAAWRDHAPRLFPLPHPSWRNTGWLKKNPWFETDLLPVLRARIVEVLQ
jgi:uracil-DNA glycosylase